MGNYDGDVTLTVDLQPGDVKSTASKLQTTFNELSKIDFGKNLSKSFSKILQDMKDTGIQAKGILKQLRELEEVRPTEAYTKLGKELDALSEKQTALNEKIRSADMKKTSLYARVQAIRDEINAKNEQIKKENELIRLQNENKKGPKKQEKPLIDYRQNDEYKRALTDARRASMQAMNYQKALTRVSSAINDVTQQMTAMEQAGTHVFNETNTKQYENLIDTLKELNAMLTQYTNIASTAANSPSFTPDTITAKWQSLMAVLKETHPTIANIGASLGETVQTGFENLQDRISNIPSAIQDIGDAWRNARSDMQQYEAEQQRVQAPDPTMWSLFANYLKMTHPILGSLVNGFVQLGQLSTRVAVSMAKFAGGAIISGLKNIAKWSASAASNLARMVGDGITSGFKRLASAIGLTNKASSNANGTFKKGFLFILRYAFGIRSIYFMFRRLRKALKEGLGNLAQYSPGFNSVISDFISALTRLKNTFATAFAPIINVVLPIITTFINAMSDAVTKIGMFIAALTGQKTFIRAKAVQEDYAASLDKTTGATNAANEAAKDYQKTISGFDDVEILKNPDTDSGSGGSGGGGGGGGGTSPQDMFETVELPAGFYDLAQMIKDAWEDADFTDVGNLLGTKIAEALNNIPWETIKEKANKFGKSFATFINGLLSAEGLASAVGTTIGEGINTLFTFANGFISNLEWSNVGAFFAEVMNKGIATIQWTLVASTFANAANGILNAADTWAKKFNFAMLGTAIGNAVAYALNHIEWDTAKEAASSLGSGVAAFINNAITPESLGSVGTALAEVINTVISGIQGFAITFNQTNLGLAIATGINNFFTKLDLEKAGVTFTTLSSKILTGLTTAVQNIEWYDIGVEIKDGIKAIDWGKLFSNAAELAGSVAGGIASLISGLFSGLGTAITEYFAEKKNQCGGNIVAGVFMGIADFFISIGTWIKTNILDPFVSGFKSTFGIHSPASNTTIVELGKNIILGIVQGIIDWISDIKTWIKTNILDKFTTAWNDLGGLSGIVGTAISVGVELAKKGWSTVSGWFSGLGTTITEAVTNIKANLENKFGKVSSWFSGLGSTITEHATAIGANLENKFGKVSSWFSGLGTTVTEAATNISANLANKFGKVSSWFKGLGTTVTDAATSIKANLSNGFGKVSSWFKGLGTTVTEHATNISANLANKFSSVSKWFSGLGDKVTDASTNISTYLSNKFGSVKNWFTKLGAKKTVYTNKIGTYLSNKFGSVKEWFNNLNAKVRVAGTFINVGLHKAWSSLQSWFNEITTGNAKKRPSVGVDLHGVGVNNAAGGAYYGGSWHKIAQYATGGLPRHGTQFVAGEAGPEVVGHIGGRTEVLNQSQLAAVMYSSIVAGMSPVISHITVCTNAIIATMGSALSYLNLMTLQIQELNTVTLPNIVTGKIVPSMSVSSDVKEIKDTLSRMNSALDSYQNNVVTKDELADVLVTMFTRYMNLHFYVGDEDLARHVNRGNAKMDLRLNPVKG